MLKQVYLEKNNSRNFKQDVLSEKKALTEYLCKIIYYLNYLDSKIGNNFQQTKVPEKQKITWEPVLLFSTLSLLTVLSVWNVHLILKTYFTNWFCNILSAEWLPSWHDVNIYMCVFVGIWRDMLSPTELSAVLLWSYLLQKWITPFTF